ncbi:hypothetical protein SAMN05444266_11157 [Chitinophaga jiangningensis]|uniref:Transcriptional regulator n=1 Tax=Chitinophaga jiangningensis TaxID=1419482 RepID=A0A1M7LNB4_9BACT|nr:YtfJ family protein [Chitinophaga jiangningensis]SHM79687.1 hypothetical protein SAMN05444266_11157 [Chitinophaga jiangningensis]
MKYLVLLLLILAGIPASAQLRVGDRVSQVTIRDASNNPMKLPYWGQKAYLIFYPDPDHASQNKTITDYLKQHPVSSTNIFSFGVVNLNDAPLLPNSIVRMMVRREVKQTGADIYTDVDNTLSRSWRMGDVNNKFVIIFVDKNHIVRFFKAGELTTEEQKELLRVIKEFS